MDSTVNVQHVFCPTLRRATMLGGCYATVLQNPWAEQILRDFRWREYMRAHQDLKFESEQHARWHFVYNGYKEGRLFDADRCVRLDPIYYRSRYPELGLDTDQQAQFHYCYAGYYENRFANADTEWLYNVDLHVYQLGKVGSHSIAAALQGKFPGSVLHLHWVTDIPLHYPSCSLSYAHILGHARERPVRVISACREVVSRVLSGTLQFMSTIEHNSTEFCMENAIAHLEDTFLHDCDVILGWFDHQFYCGLDIYTQAFDYEKGYVRIANDTVDLFLYRYEDIIKLEKPLTGFLGMPEFKLTKSNTSEDKQYSQIYDELRKKFVVARHILEELYNTRYMRFFYSDEERERFIDYWSAPR